MSDQESIQIYHNPRCSKSRQTLQLLRDQGIEPEIIEYLKAPPTAAELKTVLQKLGMRPRELLRKQEKEYKLGGMADDTLSDDELIELMVKYPKVIERPIVIKGQHAALGRPPEHVLDILS